tara:strand:- start:1695 stop:2933 length:1239 start_codon:yes stop_codon:yes gene_type:complete
MTTRDKEERRLKKAKITLMRHKKFALYSGVMMVGKTVLDDTFPTACTDGRNEIYGREFLKQLTDKNVCFVVLHENLHKLFKHMFIWRKLFDENPQLANAACDFVINLMLVNTDPTEEVIAMPQKDGKPWGCLDRKYAGMNAKQVFDELKKEQKSGKGGDGKGGDGKGTGVPEGFDEHDWKGAKELSEADRKELEKELDRAIRQGQIAHAKMNGKGGADMPLEIGDLLTPKIDWREVLREFINSICQAKDTSSWRRINRRLLAADIYMPSLVGERVGHVVVGIDTSGSIGKAELTAFISELKFILENVHPEKMDLLYWDTEVENHEVYTEGNMQGVEAVTQVRGGGGTNPVCVDKYLKDKAIHPECIIMLTDGYVGDWGNAWEAPTLWAIIDNPTCTAPVGKTMHLETGDMHL